MGNLQTFEIRLEGFSFPEELDDSKANFRFIVDLRYIDPAGDFATEHAVMPSLDTYWECDKGKSTAPNFVRFKDEKWKPRFDMSKIDDWDCLVLRLKAQDLYAIQVKVIDVDRADIWDKLKGALQGVLEGVLGTLRGRIAARIPGSVGGQPVPPAVHHSLGSAADDVEAFLLKKLAGGDDVLFRGSKPTAAVDRDKLIHVTGRGTRGIYTVAFSAASVD